MPVKFGLENTYMRTWLLLHQTYNSILKCENKVFNKYGITNEQHSVLMAIKYINKPVTPTEVAKWLDRNTNSISLIVDRMVKAGLLSRKKDLRDHRAVRLVITESGKKVTDRATVAGWVLVQEMLSPLSEKEMRNLAELLEKVRDKAFSYLNPGEIMEEIKRNESKNMTSFTKRMTRFIKNPASTKHITR
jgi:DNA-binding MarR family transcriptional regulator